MNDYITRIDNFMAPLAEIVEARLARVGGSVRDEILGRRVKDGDYVVFGVDLDTLGWILKNTQPFCHAQISPLKLRDGRQAGWRVLQKGYGLIEIALPRKEVSTGDGHRDFEIVLDPDLTPAEDAARRDFTFNALYKWIGGTETRSEVFGPTGAVITNVEDPTGRGLFDLGHKLVNTTHPDSFRDDPLRILRAIRFVSVLDYELGIATCKQMIEHADAVNGLNFQGNTSGTVLTEMDKLLMGDSVGRALRLMRDTGVMAHLFPELAPMIGHDPNSNYHDLNTDEHTIRAIEAAAKVDAPLWVRWALLFHDSGKPETGWMGLDGRLHFYEPSDAAWSENVANSSMSLNEPKPVDHEVASERRWLAFCDRANVPKGLRDTVATIIREHMVTVQPRNMVVKVRRMRVKFGDQMTHDILLHRSCDLMGKNKTSLASIGHIADQEKARIDAEVERIPTSAKDLEINGHDVAGLGMRGAAIGKVLAAVLDEVICQPDDMRRTRTWQMTAAARNARRFA